MKSWLTKLETSCWGAPLLLIVPFLAILSPILLGNRLFASGDILEFHYPQLFFIQDSLQSGNSVLWNSTVFSGFPSYALGVFFNPAFWLVKYFSVFGIYHWLIIANLFFAALLFNKFLRSSGFEFWPAILSALVYPFALWPWVVDIGLVSALPLLPALLLIVNKIRMGKKTGLFVALGGLAVAYGFYIVNFNLLPFVFLLALVYSIFLDLTSQENKVYLRYRSLLHFVVIAVVGLILALPQLVGTYEVLNLSARESGLAFSEVSAGALQIFDVSKLFLPYANGPFGFSGSVMYFGVLPLFFLLLAMFQKKDLLSKLFFWVFVISIIAAVKFSPITWIFSKIPLLESMRSPSRWLFLAGFSGAFLVGQGMRSLSTFTAAKTFTVIRKIFQGISITVIAIMALVTAAGHIFFDELKNKLFSVFEKSFFDSTSGLPLFHYQNVVEKILRDAIAAFDLLSYKGFFTALFIVVAFFVIRILTRRESILKIPDWKVFLVIVANLALLWWPYHPTAFQERYVQQNSISQNLSSDPEAKYFTFLPGFSEFQALTVPYDPKPEDVVEFKSYLLPPNYSSVKGGLGADYYNNLQNRRMSRLMALLGSDRATTGEKLSDEEIAIEEKVKKFQERKHILDILGIKYIVSTYPLDEQLFKKVVETTATRFEIPIYLYENPEARESVYLADDSTIIPPDELAGYDMALSSHLVGHDIFVECQSECVSTSGQANGEVEVLERGNGSWTIRVESSDSRWLVVGENFLPGWQASIDGQDTPIIMVNSVLMGILVPPGQHEVILNYGFPKFK